ncbi:Protein CBG00802 [Caenorhabditis briggsae]|uniref:Protein CBG00802 n=2 Tax=Caenorhabditis briggsae TaxID=6238 RepID=A8WNV3_CAEBR|nr:Protein CBG00802 [Caenorhabditis briggsae]ULT86423.1 hypothetical protein L3Y34_006249 [Caenorhabditis briggsae]CAP22159.1 Protein CBG00802 [Caenorhabditis briggsae]
MEDCIPSSNDLADPKIYTLIFHIITCLEMPIHAYGAYCILYKTPLQMASVKWIMLYCHVLNALLDLSISLSVPYIFHPTYSGLALGIINFPELQVYIVTSLFGLVTVSIWCIYENRYYILYGENENPFWCNARKPVMVINHMSTLLYFVPAFFELPNQDKAFVDLKKILPCNIQQFYDDRKVFILTLDSATPLYCVFFFNLFAVGQCLIFFITTLTKLIRQSRNKALAASQRTLKMRRKLVMAIVIQTLCPCILISIPMEYLITSTYLNHYDQSLNRLVMIFFALHGIFATLTMVFIHQPYREATFESVYWLFRWTRKARKADDSQKVSAVVVTM